VKTRVCAHPCVSTLSSFKHEIYLSGFSKKTHSDSKNVLIHAYIIDYEMCPFIVYQNYNYFYCGVWMLNYMEYLKGDIVFHTPNIIFCYVS
jgi:hypothetical protein